MESAHSIGPYRIVQPLGTGAMGVVYLARHGETGRKVALKTVRLASGAVLQSLRREILALARIRHPGVVRILDEGIDSGLPWYAMELLDGNTLRQVVSELHPNAAPIAAPRAFRDSSPTGGSMDQADAASQSAWWTAAMAGTPTPGAPSLFGATAAPGVVPARPTMASRGAPTMASLVSAATDTGPPEGRVPAGGGSLAGVLTLARRLCAPLSYLHGEGIVHRDLKPDNIFVRTPAPRRSGVLGWPVLVDFGLMTQFSGRISRERFEVAGSTVGTAAYMAPEQVLGELVDARADLYALGCILYELVTGRKPFPGKSLRDVLRAQLEAQPKRPSELAEGVPDELERLILRLLHKDKRERLGHADDVAAVLRDLGADDDAGAEIPEPKSYLYRPDFEGRRQSLQRLQRGLTSLEMATGSVFLLGGESGAGKTRLAMELAKEAEARHILVLVGENPPTAGGRGSGPLASLARPLEAIADRCLEGGREETERLLGPRGKLLAAYLPVLADLPGQHAHPEPAPLPAEAARMRLYQALTVTFSAMATPSPYASPPVPRGEEVPPALVLVLDDLQWADELTLGWLRFLLESEALATLPLLIVGTYRTDEVAADARAALRPVLDAPGVHLVDVGKLDAAAIGAMVSDMLAWRPAPTELVRSVAVQSEGNPFFVAEYLRAAVADGLLRRDGSGRWRLAQEAVAARTGSPLLTLPGSVRELVERRLQGLSLDALEVASAAAVLGRESTISVLSRMRGGKPGAASASDVGQRDRVTLTALEELLRRQALEETEPGRIRFVHDQIREIAYARLDAGARRKLHRAAAEALTGAPDLAVLGHHWERAGELDLARENYLAAARSAASRSAHEEAERLYRAGLALAADDTTEAILARCDFARDVLVIRGRVPEAVTELERARDAAERMGDLGAKGRCLVELGRAHLNLANLTLTKQYNEEALAIFQQIDDPAGEAMALRGIAIALDIQGYLEEAGKTYERARDRAARANRPVEELAMISNLAVLESKRGRYHQAVELHERGILLARQSGDRSSEALNLVNLAIIRRRLGRLTEARGLAEQAVEIFEQIGYLRFEGMALVNLGNILADLGQPHRAREAHEQALALERRVGDRRIEAHALLYLATVARRAEGDLERAQTLLDECRASAGFSDDAGMVVMHLSEQGHLALARGESPAPALDRLHQIPEKAKPGSGSAEGAAMVRLERAAAAAAAGQPLLHGEVPEDIPAPLRSWIERHGAGTRRS